ncbi:MAG TPA: hypothetical protein VFQ13_06055 [Anaerolineales bacterium]|nr:hypothetical protein [Anaerolineales bacterium]
MFTPFHVEMTRLALEDRFSARALERIIAANLYQDRPRGQIGHDEYHFDNNAFEKSYAYLEEQRTLTISSLMVNDAPAAWSAFGRLTHTAQDFYAHSNYVHLWLARQPEGAPPTPPEIDPVDPNVIQSDALRSGRIYLFELLSFIPGLKSFVLSRLPRDAHGWMNLDSPERGPNFEYAFHAGVKRTRIEFEQMMKGLPNEVCQLFLDKEI